MKMTRNAFGYDLNICRTDGAAVVLHGACRRAWRAEHPSKPNGYGLVSMYRKGTDPNDPMHPLHNRLCNQCGKVF